MPNILTFYKKPLLLHEGHMQWLWDHEGRRYLDFLAGIVTISVGHCHPSVLAIGYFVSVSVRHRRRPRMHAALELIVGHWVMGEMGQMGRRTGVGHTVNVSEPVIN